MKNICPSAYAGELVVRTDRTNEHIVEAPMRTLPPLVNQRPIRFGTVDHGLDLMRFVWKRERQVLSMQDQDLQKILPHRPKRVESKPWDQQRGSVLKRNPLDALLVEASGLRAGRRSLWPKLRDTPEENRPKIIAIIYEGPESLTQSSASWRRGHRKQLERLGYHSQEWFLN